MNNDPLLYKHCLYNSGRGVYVRKNAVQPRLFSYSVCVFANVEVNVLRRSSIIDFVRSNDDFKQSERVRDMILYSKNRHSCIVSKSLYRPLHIRPCTFAQCPKSRPFVRLRSKFRHGLSLLGKPAEHASFAKSSSEPAFCEQITQ